MTDSEDDAPQGALVVAKNTLLLPFQAAISKPARRFYISTLLLLVSTLVLLGISISAYILFYNTYIPRIGFERVVHLQFPVSSSHPSSRLVEDDGTRNGRVDTVWPTGTANLGADIVSQQPYDVDVVLHVPRSPGNLALGNFMVDLELMTETQASVEDSPLHPDVPVMGGNDTGGGVLARSSRSTMLTYRSEALEGVGKAAALPLYVSGLWGEDEWLEVGMMEGVRFARGWTNVPKGLRIRLRMDERGEGRLRVYGCWVKFRARLKGLRYWFTSFIAFTVTFWIVSVLTAVLAWISLSYILFPSRPKTTPAHRPRPNTDSGSTTASPAIHRQARSEPGTPSLSDTSRTFPTMRGQPPLTYSNGAGSARETGRSDDPGRDSGLGSSLPEEVTGRSQSARHYPTPTPEPQERQELAQTPVTPGEAADDEDDEVELVNGGGSGVDLGSQGNDSVRRRRSGFFRGSGGA
ncbi:MAG: hypothetical protein M1820_009148 [Bogoriella megaspora]|nr:MAG: hypothetical protein M1820_009148 [Bogoriella megaspora]